jgi:iron complex outermembrane recepter protein
MQTVNGNDSVSGAPDLRNAIRFALATGAGAVAGLGAQQAVAQTAPAAKASDNQGLEEIIVTGTRIRRVDAESASPILTINSDTIAASGVQTVGELVSQLPTVAGAAINPAVNNGGGFGEANVELRGLDAKRTLVLLNGRRVGLVGASGAVDVNQIPINMIDHVEVLKEGAGAIYGSDAIAGVVNFITKTKSDGLELGGEYGMTSRGDGEHESLSALFGTGSDKMDFTIGGSYTRQKQVSAGDRDYSRLARYLYSGLYSPTNPGVRTQYEFDAGSSRIPNGRVTLSGPLRKNKPGPNGEHDPALGFGFGCHYATRLPGAAGTSLADYRCYTGADAFNYQPYNLLMTPQERGAMFSTVNYRMTDNTEIYAEVLMNRTHSGFEIAPLPFDATSDNVIVSKDNIYNPFGLDFGGQTTLNGNFRLRLYTLGDRFSQTTSDSKLMTAGVKGKLFGSAWQWDANVSYGRLDQSAKVNGYIFFPDLAKAVGPSFIDPVNGPTCGTVASPIPNCTPMNIFNESDPATLAQLHSMSTDYKTDNTFTTKAAAFNVNGKVATLPAGDMQAALGFEYRDLGTVFEADHLVVAQPPLFINCIISQEACTGPSAASYDDKELYGELFAPILKDAPGAKALNLDVGVRYSKYSQFGATTKGQFKLEYRPVSDLLLRGTYAQVFRVPTLADIAAAPTASNPTYKDPCYGLTPAAIAAQPNLALVCAGVAQDGSFAYAGTSQISAILLSNPTLKPESGNVITYGFVLQIPHVTNWSVSVDSWRYELNDLITPLDPNYVSDQCLATGAAEFCGLIHRLSAGVNQGEIEAFLLPTVNLGTLKTEGTDIGTKYLLKGTRAGDFQFSLDTTYISTYENNPGHGAPTVQYAGTYNNQFGNYARVRGMGTIGWAKGDLNALLTARYIHHLVVHNPATQSGAVLGLPEADLKIPSIMYFDLTLGYNIKGTKTKLQFGIQNLADKLPPIFYQNNTINADTNVETYDTLGRRYFLTFNQKF